MTTAYALLSAHEGVRVAALADAMHRLDLLDDTEVTAVSRIYESDTAAAVAVARVETTMSAQQLAGWLGDIAEGVSGSVANSSRITTELLLFGDDEWRTPELTLPTPGLAERDAVLTPLLEIAPGVQWPDGTPVRATDVLTDHVVGDLGTEPGFEDRRVPLADLIADDEAVRRAEARRAGTAVGVGADDAWPDLDPGDEWTMLVAVSAVSSWARVRVIQGVLRSAGIPCVQMGVLASETIGIYLPMSEPVRLLVPRSRLAEANEVLARTSFEPGGLDDGNALQSGPNGPAQGGHVTWSGESDRREGRRGLSPASARLGWAALLVLFVVYLVWGRG